MVIPVWPKYASDTMLIHHADNKWTRLLAYVTGLVNQRLLSTSDCSLRQKAEDQEGGLKEGSPITQFVIWANRYADSLDSTGAPLEDLDDEEP
jgi:hypothetical protein